MEIKTFTHAGASAAEQIQIPQGPGNGKIVGGAFRPGKSIGSLVRDDGGGRNGSKPGQGRFRDNIAVVQGKDCAAGKASLSTLSRGLLLGFFLLAFPETLSRKGMGRDVFRILDYSACRELLP